MDEGKKRYDRIMGMLRGKMILSKMRPQGNGRGKEEV